MYIDPQGTGSFNQESMRSRLIAATLATGEAAFTWWNGCQPMAALPGTPEPVIADSFIRTASMDSLTQAEVLSRVLVDLDGMGPGVAAITLGEEARARRVPTAGRVEQIIMWSLLGCDPNESYLAWLETRRRVRETDWLNVRLPAALPTNVRLASEEVATANLLFWLRWEAGVNVAQARFDGITLRATAETSVSDILEQMRT